MNAQTFNRSTTLSIIYIACCSIVLMCYNGFELKSGFSNFPLLSLRKKQKCKTVSKASVIAIILIIKT